MFLRKIQNGSFYWVLFASIEKEKHYIQSISSSLMARSFRNIFGFYTWFNTFCTVTSQKKKSVQELKMLLSFETHHIYIANTEQKKNKNFFNRQIYQYFDLQFFANILILIVLIDYLKKTLGYRGSCVVTFENLEIFRFLRGPNGGFPPKFFKKKIR